jgi:hypothetical protein
MVNEAIYLRRKDVVYFDPGTVKMLAKGDPKIPGKMFKQDMVAAAKSDTGVKGRFNHNEADAYHVARFSARFWLFLSRVEKLMEGPPATATVFREKILTRQDPVKMAIEQLCLTPAEQQAFAKVHTFTRGEKAGHTVLMGALFKENQRFYRFSRISPDENL